MRTRKGVSVVEIVVASVIALVVLIALWMLQWAVSRAGQRSEDLAGALDRARWAMERIRADADGSLAGRAGALDDGSLGLWTFAGDAQHEAAYAMALDRVERSCGQWRSAPGVSLACEQDGPALRVQVRAEVRGREITLETTLANETAARMAQFPEWSRGRRSEF